MRWRRLRARDRQLLGALCGRFDLEVDETLENITCACARDDIGCMVSCEDQVELLAQARLLVEGDDEYRCLIIHDHRELLEDWSELSKDDVMDALAKRCAEEGIAVCFVTVDAEAALSEVTVKVRGKLKECTGSIEGSRSVFSDLFDAVDYADPEADAAAEAAVETMIAALEEEARKAAEEVAKREAAEAAWVAANVQRSRHLLRASHLEQAAEVAATAAEAEAAENAADPQEDELPEDADGAE